MLEAKWPIGDVIKDVATYPGMDGRGLYNVHYRGRIAGYSHGGTRVRKAYIPGMGRNVACPMIPGITKTIDVIPDHEIRKEKALFEKWASARGWYKAGSRVDVVDDYQMRRVEYRIILR